MNKEITIKNYETEGLDKGDGENKTVTTFIKDNEIIGLCGEEEHLAKKSTDNNQDNEPI